MTDTIRSKLTAAFHPTELDVIDDSAKHAGHTGSRPGGETHFTVKIVTPLFAGLSHVERQRRVYKALNREMQTQIHALSLITLAPGE